LDKAGFVGRGRLFGLLIVMAALALVAPTALPLAGTLLVIEDHPQPADVAFMTYGALVHAGVDEVVRLQRDGYAPRVVVSDFELDVAGIEERGRQALATRALVARGVPSEAISPLPGMPASEDAEARMFADLAAREGWRRIIVVARDYRMRRTVGALGGALRGRLDADLIARPVPTEGVTVGGVDWNRWWDDRVAVSAVMNEWPRIGYYAARGWF
jgi:uncharacterized SAM-binding protein YcdF (DUF218 family)